MDELVRIRRKRIRRSILIFAGCAIAVVTGGWLYKTKTQRDLNMQLLGAVKRNNTSAVRLLLAHGADPNIRDMPEHPLSLWEEIKHAFHRGSPSAARSGTILQGSQIQITVGPGGSMQFGRGLIRAKMITVNGRQITNFVGSTIPNGSDILEPTILEMSSYSDEENAPLVKALLDAGARTGDSSYGHQTPLMQAVASGRIPTIQALLDHGANLLARDDSGGFPIHYLNSNTPAGLKIAEMLVKSGADINAVDNEGMTPLINLASSDDASVVRFLLAHGAKVNARSKDGSSALIEAAMSESTAVTRLLLDHGANVNSCDQRKVTALDYAASGGPLPIVKMLLAHGAKVDPVDADGDTPLTSCLQPDYANRPDIVKVLIEHGADVNHLNKANQTPLSLAKKQKYKAVIKLLMAAGAKP